MTHERENFNYMDFLSYKPLFEEHMKKLYDAAKEETPIAQIPIGELQLDVAPATAAEIYEIQRILNQGAVVNPMDYQILNIIDEEADSYFGGAKTEKQAAEVIQNRVQLYLDENK